MNTPRWYMLNKMGMATLCTDREDAEKEAVGAQIVWPRNGPHRAVQLVEASFEAADMATASAQGFRDGVASLAASAGGPVVNRATVIEWLDANDIEVTDRQLGGLFHFSAPPTAQAEGWRLVPVEPTQEMIDAMRSSVWLPACYRAMLAAAPCPPTSAEGVEHG